MIITLEDNALIADINKARREYANGETIILHALLVKLIAANGILPQHARSPLPNKEKQPKSCVIRIICLTLPPKGSEL